MRSYPNVDKVRTTTAQIASPPTEVKPGSTLHADVVTHVGPLGNLYRRVSFMQGGRPFDVPGERVEFLPDHRVLIDDEHDGQRWRIDDGALEISTPNGDPPQRFCRYSSAVTGKYLGFLFDYGSMLVPQSVRFPLPLRDIDDNPAEPLNDHLSRVHPKCKRIISRACDDFFDLFKTGGNYLEIGVGFGNYAQLIRDRLRPREIHLLDCWREIEGVSDHYSQENLNEAFRSAMKKFSADSGRVHVHRGLSRDLLETLPRDHFDLVYIDADHTEAGCYSDLQGASKLIRAGGYLCGHDYTKEPNSTDARVERIHYGVIDAVTRFCESSEWEMRYLTIEVEGWCFPSYVLRRGEG